MEITSSASICLIHYSLVNWIQNFPVWCHNGHTPKNAVAVFILTFWVLNLWLYSQWFRAPQTSAKIDSLCKVLGLGHTKTWQCLDTCYLRWLNNDIRPISPYYDYLAACITSSSFSKTSSSWNSLIAYSFPFEVALTIFIIRLVNTKELC